MDNFNALVPHIEYYVYRKCHPTWVIESSVIDFHDLSYIMSGWGIFVIDGKEMPVTAGDVVYIPSNRRRQAWTFESEPMELFAINFVLLPYQDMDNDSVLPLEQVNQIGYDPKLVNLFTRLTRVWAEKEALYEMDARALVMQIISELLRRLYRNKPANRYDKRIEQVKDYINENYQLALTVPLLAEKVGLHPTYFGTLFMQSEACSLHEYINKIRINHAYEILRTENLTVKEVAYSCGFTDTFYFSRVFKKMIGLPPSRIHKLT